VTREASLSAGESVDPLSPEPRLEPRLSPTLRIGARISRRASCNRMFSIRERRPRSFETHRRWPFLSEVGPSRVHQGPSGSRLSTDSPSPRSRGEGRQILATPRNRADEQPSSRGPRGRGDRVSACLVVPAEEVRSRARPRSLARVLCSRLLSSEEPHRWEPFIHKLITACGWIGSVLSNTPIRAIALFSPRARSRSRERFGFCSRRGHGLAPRRSRASKARLG